VELNSARMRETKEGDSCDVGKLRICGHLNAGAWWWTSLGRQGHRGTSAKIFPCVLCILCI